MIEANVSQRCVTADDEVLEQLGSESVDRDENQKQPTPSPGYAQPAAKDRQERIRDNVKALGKPARTRSPIRARLGAGEEPSQKFACELIGRRHQKRRGPREDKRAPDRPAPPGRRIGRCTQLGWGPASRSRVCKYRARAAFRSSPSSDVRISFCKCAGWV